MTVYNWHKIGTCSTQIAESAAAGTKYVGVKKRDRLFGYRYDVAENRRQTKGRNMFDDRLEFAVRI